MNWGLGMALVYGVFASGTLTFAWFAMHQPVALVSEDYYERAIDHDRRQAAEARGRALGRSFSIDVDESGRRVVLRWADARTRPDAGTITFYRPSNPAWDRTILMAPDGDGRQHLSLVDLPAGSWVLRLQWTMPAGDVYLERHVMLR